MNKEQFCLYLEELAAEIRAFTMTRAYLDEMYPLLLQHAKKFYDHHHELASLKVL